MSKPVVEAMHRHVVDLCEANDIWLHWLRHGDWNAYAIREADGGADEIMVPVIKSSISYATALHEIGHILGRHQSSRNSMTRERWAWQWARKNALEWTPSMERHAAECLRDASINA
jgi:hypothetical protein